MFHATRLEKCAFEAGVSVSESNDGGIHRRKRRTPIERTLSRCFQYVRAHTRLDFAKEQLCLVEAEERGSAANEFREVVGSRSYAPHKSGGATGRAA